MRRRRLYEQLKRWGPAAGRPGHRRARHGSSWGTPPPEKLKGDSGLGVGGMPQSESVGGILTKPRVLTPQPPSRGSPPSWTHPEDGLPASGMCPQLQHRTLHPEGAA
ncbi:unnamed protein product [Rangifer tarandus platyrhynchus]|uniref:Uncharacterized protein n=1 Tax=Rangifer tarandus platyrhynchus TaxID=3082113 RepID=A0AC59Z6C5_RANTA